VWEPDLIQDQFRRALTLGNDGAPTTDSIQTALAAIPVFIPIHFDQLCAVDFMAWIVSMKSQNGSYFRFTTYGTHHSALKSLYSDFDTTTPAEMEKSIANRFGGLKKRIARKKTGGHGEIKEGKDSLPFSLFRRIGLGMLRGTSRDLVCKNVHDTVLELDVKSGKHGLNLLLTS
jgi:hypothetical protein